METWTYLVLLAVSLAHLGILVYMVNGTVTRLRPPEGAFLVILLILVCLSVHAVIVGMNNGSGREAAWILLIQLIVSVVAVHKASQIVRAINTFLPFDR